MGHKSAGWQPCCLLTQYLAVSWVCLATVKPPPTQLSLPFTVPDLVSMVSSMSGLGAGGGGGGRERKEPDGTFKHTSVTK